MISRTISTSEKLHKINWKARLLFTWMILHCDDEGRTEGSRQTIKARVLPMADCTEKEVEEWLGEMKKVGLIEWYKIDGKKYIQIIRWHDFQTFHGIQVNQSRFPAPPDLVERSTPKISKGSKERKEKKVRPDFSHLPNIGSKLKEAE